jgi:CheY-like chemotaxis protein
VDDNRDAADSLAEVLQAYGHRVNTVYGGEEAIDAAARGDVQVALVDIGMPTVDGFQVAERISRSPEGKATLLVAVTGWGEKADRERSKQAGFAYHLTKPVDFDALASLLSTAARKAQQQARA